VATVTFLPAGVTVEVRDGTSVFHAAARAEVAIPSQCGGKCACALCRVKVVEGDAVLSPMRWEEEGHLGNCYHLTQERLSCQLRVFGEVVVEVPEDDTPEKPRSRYIPYSLIRKREKMERDEELRRARRSGGSADQSSRERSEGGSRSGEDAPGSDQSVASGGEAGTSGGPGRGKSQARAGSEGGRSPSRGRRSSRRRARKRTTGSLRPGETRPPEGARKKD